MKKKKQRGEKKNVPPKYTAQMEKQNSDWSRVGVVAQMNREEEGESLETEMIKEMGK